MPCKERGQIESHPSICFTFDKSEYPVRDKRHHHCHVETVSSDGGNTPIAKDDRLDNQDYRYSKHGGPWSEQDGYNPSSDRMTCSASRNWDVKHHDQKEKAAAIAR